MECVTMITSDVYCKISNKLERAIQNKLSGMLTFGVVVLHENDRPHNARKNSKAIEAIEIGYFLSSPLQPRLGVK